MKKIISFILCIAMLLSPVQIVFADENEEEFYNTVSVEFSDSIGNLETIEVMVKDDNVYANVEELAARLGYDVSISDKYVSVYNKEVSENIPYCLTVFYYDSTKVSHMLFSKMVDTYEAPCETLKNENGVWIPLEYSLLLLNSSMLIVENTILIDMPSKNVIDVYMDILKNNQTYLFDWNEDFGYTEFEWKLVGSASHVVNMFNGLLKKDGATWSQFVEMYAMDSSSYDSKYSEAIAELFCTYSDSELKKEVSQLKEIMGHFNGSGTLGKTLKALEKSVPTDEDIGKLQKVCKDLKNKIDEGNGSVNTYNRAYQALENACDEATLFQNTAGIVLDVQKNVKNATGIVKKLFLVAEVIGYAKEFQNQDEFAVDSLTKFIQNKDSESVMSNAMKSGIEVYTDILQTNILTYSALRYLMKNYNSLLMDAVGLSSAFETEATLVLIAWDLVQSANILNIGDKIKAADKFELATYSTIFQSDAFVDYQEVRDDVFSKEENIIPENLYKVAQSCYAYLKFCYITRDAAIASLKAKTENTQEVIQPLVDYQKNINEEIAGYLVQIKNADTTNKSKCYGFLPEDNVEYLKKYNSEKLLILINSLNSENAYKESSPASDSEAYNAYQNAMHTTMASGSWTENLTMTADMTLTQGKSKVKTKATIESVMKVDNCFEDDLSNAVMSGSASMSVMGQSYAWNVVYENGIAHYEYTEPNITSVDIEMDISCFDFGALIEDMMHNAKVFGNKITFTVSGADMQEAEIVAVNLMSGIENLEYGDIEVEVLIDKETGIISEIIMDFHASLTYQGYDAEVDYYIDYRFNQ